MTKYVSSTRAPQVATDFRLPGSNERVVGLNGEVNANSRKELLSRNLSLAAAAGEGQVVTETEATNRAVVTARNKELIMAAFDSPASHKILGERLADQIYMTSNRKGYARRFLNRVELKAGEIPRFPVRKKNVQAVMITGPAKLESSIITDRWLTPPELEIATRLFVPQMEINQSNTDVLEEKYIEGLEAIMVTEDRMWLNAVNATIGVDNDLQIISGTLSPLTLMGARQQVQRWGMKAAFCLMANDLFVDIVGDASFIQAIEPVSRHELVLTGEMAVLYGMTLISEAYRHPEHQTLTEGQAYIVSDPAFHGAFSDRGGVDAMPTDASTERVSGRGWLLSEFVSMAIANTRSVSAFRRV